MARNSCNWVWERAPPPLALSVTSASIAGTASAAPQPSQRKDMTSSSDCRSTWRCSIGPCSIPPCGMALCSYLLRYCIAAVVIQADEIIMKLNMARARIRKAAITGEGQDSFGGIERLRQQGRHRAHCRAFQHKYQRRFGQPQTFKRQKHPAAHPNRGCGTTLIIDGMIFTQQIDQQG